MTYDTTPAATPAAPPARPPVCGARAFLPLHLVGAAVALAEPGTAEPADVERYLRCTLEAHPLGGDHYALVMDLAGPDTGSVWTQWPTDAPPSALTVLPDCPAVSPTHRDPCSEFATHPGAHSFALTDDWPLP